MPLIKRHIEPVFVSRTPIPPQVNNELECGTNSTLSNIIRQLSSLSRFAEDLFAELAYEANSIYTRAVTLQQRGERLRAKVAMLNSNQDEVSIHDIHLRKPFRSSGHLDQQVVNRMTMPHALQETFDGSDPPPALYKFNPYRDDGRDSMKFYTDSTYFLEIWAQEMNRDMEKHRKQRRPRQRPSPRHEPKQPRPIQTRQEQYAHLKDGVDLIPETVHEKRSNDVVSDHMNNHDPVRPSTLELSRPNGELVKPSSDSGFISMPPGPIDSSSSESSTPGPRRPTVLPPAPPPPVHRPVQSPPAPPIHRSVTGESLDLPPPPSPLLAHTPAPSPPPDSFVPPPPPPPPPPVAPPASWGTTESNGARAPPVRAPPIRAAPQAPTIIPEESANNPRSDLLLQIQRGFQLRKVEQQGEGKPRLSNGLIDVKEIMDRAFESRRKAMEDSSSEEESVSEWDDE